MFFWVYWKNGFLGLIVNKDKYTYTYIFLNQDTCTFKTFSKLSAFMLKITKNKK